MEGSGEPAEMRGRALSAACADAKRPAFSKMRTNEKTCARLKGLTADAPRACAEPGMADDVFASNLE
ncbi:hypothetical protein SAMCCGM7_Ch2030 [Sinorhizobium americanum CCGM7]|nr:hypothetical protein SAMCCGM7_Ch2030 [Sinorhizobium americanum CCGM7]